MTGSRFPRGPPEAEHGLRNADVQWTRFSPQDYWQRTYHELQAEDQGIICLVRRFFIAAFRDRLRARRGIGVGTGTNIYPGLLMLPWGDRSLLTDLSASNVRWLRRQLADDGAVWTWQPCARSAASRERPGARPHERVQADSELATLRPRRKRSFAKREQTFTGT